MHDDSCDAVLYADDKEYLRISAQIQHMVTEQKKRRNAFKNNRISSILRRKFKNGENSRAYRSASANQKRQFRNSNEA